MAQYVMSASDIARKMGHLSEAARAENAVYEPELKAIGCELDVVPRLPNVIYPGHPISLLAHVTKVDHVSYFTLSYIF